jgi:hypothetical protein
MEGVSDFWLSMSDRESASGRAWQVSRWRWSRPRPSSSRRWNGPRSRRSHSPSSRPSIWELRSKSHEVSQNCASIIHVPLPPPQYQYVSTHHLCYLLDAGKQALCMQARGVTPEIPDFFLRDSILGSEAAVHFRDWESIFVLKSLTFSGYYEKLVWKSYLFLLNM